MNRKKNDIRWFIGYLILAIVVISLPGFLYYRMKLELSVGLSIGCGFTSGMLVLWVLDFILSIFSLPKLIFKGMQKQKDEPETPNQIDQNQQTK